MAKKGNKQTQQREGAVAQLTVNPVRMTNQDIAKWKLAIDQARDPNFPRRRLLYDLYDQIKLDGHLYSVVEKRKLSLLNKKIHYTETANPGEVNENVRDIIIDAPWFNDLMSYSLDADNYGHSLCEFIMEGSEIKKVSLANRTNVIPEIGVMIWNYYTSPAFSINGKAYRDNLPIVINDNIGIFYRDNPEYSPYMIEFGKPDAYGRFMIAAQYVLLKRGAWGNWGQFIELFGSPFRVGKYDPYDASARVKLNDGLANMGSAGWASIPKGTELEMLDHNNSGKSEVFKDLIELSNSELSKIFLGNTMTTENGSSHSQSATHKEAEDELKVADMIKAEQTINFVVKPKVQMLTGINLEKGRFNYPQSSEIPLEKRITIDARLVELGIPITEEYFYNTYGVDKPKDGEQPVVARAKVSDAPKDQEKPKADDRPADEQQPAEKKKAKLSALYGHAIKHHPGAKLQLKAGDKKKLDAIWERVMKSIHDGTTKPGTIDPELVTFIREQLMHGVSKGYGSYGDGKADLEMIDNLEADVKVFSGFKTYHELREATDLLTDADGKVRPFSEFKADVLSINEQYNKVWLETEYNYAVASSQMASNWVDYQDTKSVLPNLTYRTAGDDKVREEHEVLDGICLPIDDDFWNTYYPPNDWGCRCDVDQSDAEVTDITGREFKEPPEMFRVNTAKEGVVFPSKHPYYEVSKAERQSIMEQLDDID